LCFEYMQNGSLQKHLSGTMTLWFECKYYNVAKMLCLFSLHQCPYKINCRWRQWAWLEHTLQDYKGDMWGIETPAQRIWRTNLPFGPKTRQYIARQQYGTQTCGFWVVQIVR
jgi:hypothetical protein